METNQQQKSMIRNDINLVSYVGLCVSVKYYCINKYPDTYIMSFYHMLNIIKFTQIKSLSLLITVHLFLASSLQNYKIKQLIST